jgi:hypothetical protein
MKHDCLQFPPLSHTQPIRTVRVPSSEQSTCLRQLVSARPFFFNDAAAAHEHANGGDWLEGYWHSAIKLREAMSKANQVRVHCIWERSLLLCFYDLLTDPNLSSLQEVRG